ncbi:MAG TPA: hypothetical protein DD806_08345 [Flavobacterium sp.]|jgi:hypothetical protein|nr:hypothetical protein [Flavobacterium sp.]
MKKNVFSLILNTKVIFTFAFIFHISLSHSQSIAKNTSNDFWKQMKSDYQFGEYVRAFYQSNNVFAAHCNLFFEKNKSINRITTRFNF